MKKHLFTLLLCFVICAKCVRREFKFVRNPMTAQDQTQCKVGRTGSDTDHADVETTICGNAEETVGSALILTPYIEQGRFEEAINLSSVNPDTFFSHKSYSGFLTVDKDKSSHLFFWYFPISNDQVVSTTPWILWLQGGPGSSSMDGLFNEFGPFRVGKDDTLELNPHTWHRNHSLVFIDNPVGTGYSYTDDPEGYSSDMHTYSVPLYSAVKQLVKLFPDLKTAPLFVAGESYAGKYVPALAMEIHNHKSDEDINLQGIMIGNGLIEPSVFIDSFKNYRTFGLIEKEEYEKLDPIRVALLKDINDNKSFESKRKFGILVSDYTQLAGLPNYFNFLANTMELGNYQKFLTKPNVRRAIHVGNLTFTNFNITVYDKIMDVDFLSSSRSNLETLLDHYRVFLYCGQLDLLVPCELTANTLREFKWIKTDEFLNAPRDLWYFDQNLAGYHKSGGGLTWMVIRGAGHFVPTDKPAETQNLIALWTHSLPIPTVAYLTLQNLTEGVSEYSVDQDEAGRI